jgi:CRISPR/Cas system-associated endonuclease Cas1
MTLLELFTEEQITQLQRAPLDVAVLAAEADMELEDVELDELSTQLSTYEGNALVKDLFTVAKSILDDEFKYSIHTSRTNLSNLNEILSSAAKYDVFVPEFKKALLRLAMAIVVVNEEITGTEKTQVEEIANYLDWSVTDI